MVYGIYSIYDVAMTTYTQPFFQANDEVAKRSFKLAINDPRSENLYPIRNDLELWRVGYFDDRTGYVVFKGDSKIEPETDGRPIRICNRGDAVIINKKEEETNEV